MSNANDRLQDTEAIPAAETGPYSKDQIAYLGLRAEREVRERAVSDAARAGLTISDYLRHLIMGADQPRKRKAPQAAKVEIAKFVGALNKIGSNLNQLARVSNEARLVGDWAMLPDQKAVLAAIDVTLELLTQIKADVLKQIGKQ
ncbi:MAG: hypothetical protein AAF329_06795 [Cyanobacteria bacterium P01_A01_bin.17]